MFHIKRLSQKDSLLWKNFKILALSKNPKIFFSSLEDAMHLPDVQIKEKLEKNVILGAFIDEVLVGTLGFLIFDGSKLSHRGRFFDLYVQPEYRGNGIASNLLNAMLEIAKKKVIQVHVSLLKGDEISMKFYCHYGFEWMAFHPRSLKIEKQFYDEEIMVLKFD